MSAASAASGSGNPNANGLLDGFQWASPNLTFSFPTDGSFYGSGYESGTGQNTVNFAPLNTAQQAAVISVLAQYSAVSNLQFTQINETADQHADLREAQSGIPFTADSYYPDPAFAHGEGGDTFYGDGHGWYQDPIEDGYAYDTFMHEIGLALGLKDDTTGTALSAQQDFVAYTVESYRSYAGASTTNGYSIDTWSYPQSLMLADIAAIQQLYGANYDINSGDTVYSWDPTTGEEFINGIGQGVPGGNEIFLTVWDGKGVDTYDFSNYTSNLSVDLRPGHWSTVSTAQLADLDADDPGVHLAPGNIANAYEYDNNPSSLIENAIGGSGNDTIIGNQADNTLEGGPGKDTLYGLGGNDTLEGGTGKNVLVGGAGNDILIGSGADTAVYTGDFSDYKITRLNTDTVQIADLRAGSPDGTDTVSGVEYFDFADGVRVLDQAPVVTASDVVAVKGQSFALSSLFSASDPDLGDTITKIKIEDMTDASDNGWFSVNGVREAANSVITLTLDQVAEAAFHSASGSHTLQIRAFDGQIWGAWETLTVTAPINHVPVVATADQVVQKNAVLPTTALISVTDQDQDTIVEYQFRDNAADGQAGHLVIGGVTESANQTITVSADELSQVAFQAGGGTDDISIRAFDGIGWSAWTDVRVSGIEHAPNVAASDIAVLPWQRLGVSDLVSISDPDHDSITEIQIIDTATSSFSGHFLINGQVAPSGTIITFNAADLANATYITGMTSDTVEIRAYDGSEWGTWTTFHIDTTATGHPGTVAVSGLDALGNIAEGQTMVASVADPDGAIHGVGFQWQVLDPGSATWVDITNATDAQFTPNDSAAGKELRVTIDYSDGFGPHSTESTTITVDVAHPGSVAIEGTPSEGNVLTAQVADPDSLSTVAYQWEQSLDGGQSWSDIAGATGNNYALNYTDAGKLFEVVASYTDNNGHSEAHSATTGPIVDVDQPGSVGLAGLDQNGNAIEGQQVTANVTDLDGVDLNLIQFQWQASGDGANWSDIGQDQNSYTPTSADNGEELRVVATYNDADGHLGVTATGAAAPTFNGIVGTSNGDTLVSTSQNDWMAGNGGDDTFQFPPDFGKDTIADFVPHVGPESNGDTINLSTLQPADSSLQDMIQNHHIADDDHGNTIISFDNGADTITLLHIQVSQLHDSDFILH